MTLSEPSLTFSLIRLNQLKSPMKGVSALNVVSGLALSTGAEDAAVLPESSLGMHHDMTASVMS